MYLLTRKHSPTVYLKGGCKKFAVYSFKENGGCGAAWAHRSEVLTEGEKNGSTIETFLLLAALPSTGQSFYMPSIFQYCHIFPKLVSIVAHNPVSRLPPALSSVRTVA